MRIAIYIGTLPVEKEKWSLEHWFTYEMVSRFLSSHPDDWFLLISDEPVTSFFPESTNREWIALGKVVPRLLPMYRRFNYKIPACLQHGEVRLLISMQGVLPLKVKVPSCLLLSDDVPEAGSISLREGLKRYRKRYLSRFLRKADQVVTTSVFHKQQLMSQYQVPEYKITHVSRGILEKFQPLDWKAREAVKARYTDGKEYLLYTGAINAESNIINLLKAFSVLKKKLGSEMILVLAGRRDPAFKKFPELLRTYHFRADIKLVSTVGYTEAALLTGGAYAQVIPSEGTALGNPVLEAMQCRTPVVAAKCAVYEEMGGDAVLYFDPADFNDMGEKLCELYKNEELRVQLIARADERIKNFSWEQAENAFWNAVLTTAGQATKK